MLLSIELPEGEQLLKLRCTGRPRVADLIDALAVFEPFAADGVSDDVILVDGVPVDGSAALDRVRSGGRVAPAPIGTVGASKLPGRRRHRGRERFNRPPRVLSSFDPPVLSVPVPDPPPQSTARLGVAMLLVPIVMGAVLMVVFSPIMAVFAALTPVMIGGQWLEDRWRSRRHEKRVRKAMSEAAPGFGEALADQRRLWLADQHRAAGRIGDWDAIAAGGAELWERRPQHDDFLQVTVGLAEVAWSPRLDAPGAELEPEIESELSARLLVSGAPQMVGLGDRSSLGVTGPRDPRLEAAFALVGDLCVRHGPADVQVAVVSDQAEDWHWVRWLAHTELDGASGRRLFASNDDEADALLVHLASPEGTLPGRRAAHTVLIVDREFSDDEHIRLLADVAAGAGAPCSVIYLAAAMAGLPDWCRWVLSVAAEGTGELSCPANNHTVHGVEVRRVPAQRVESMVRRLAGWDDPLTRGGAVELRPMVPLLDLLGLTAVTPEALLDRWATCPLDTLVAPIGEGVDGALWVDLVRDGPHALVGGTTGSGKSEFLRSVVAAFAATGSVQDINFLLIDYKGGSAFDLCAELPHVAGIVTDLDDHLAERALTCLESELAHRERVLREVGADDLAAFRRSVGRSLPRLLVVVDEFAALARELPDFMTSLIDVAQRGRSLGVHLVLATQRPAGVVDENIRANTNLGVALRVQTEADSRDVIRDGAAALIPRQQPGRGVARFGPSDLVPFQSAIVSAPSVGPSSPHSVDIRVLAFGLDSEAPLPRRADEGGRSSSGSAVTDIRRLLDAANGAHALSGADHARAIWPPALDEELRLVDLDPTSAGGLVFGVLDEPERQRQRPMVWGAECGSVLAFGTPSAQPDAAVAAIACQAMVQHATDELMVYAIESGRGALRHFDGLAHVGGVVRADDRERVARLSAILANELDARRSVSSPSRHPLVLLLIENYPGLVADFAGPADYGVLEALNKVVADGAAHRIFTLASANQPGGLPASVNSAVTERLVFHLADPADYAAFGLSARSVPSLPPRRCIHLASGLVGQVGLVDDSAVASVTSASIGMERHAAQIRTLPTSVQQHALTSSVEVGAERWALPVGVGDHAVAPAGFDLAEGEHALVVGTARSGRSSVLCGLARIVKRVEPGVTTTAITPRRSQLRSEDAIDELLEVPTIDDLQRISDDESRRLLLIDDVSRLDDPTGILARLVASDRSSLRIVAADRSDLARSNFGHWSREIRRSRHGLILNPQPDVDGELFAVAFPKTDRLAGDGRALLVSHGVPQVVQLADVPPNDTNVLTSA